MMTDHPSHTDTWPIASKKRRLLAVYIDFIIFNAAWGLIIWGAAQLVPALQDLPGPTKFAVFLGVELALFRFVRWSPGNQLLGIRPGFTAGFASSGQPSLLSSELFADPELLLRERWWTILFGVFALLEGLKSLVRWTIFAPPQPIFGMETSPMVSALVFVLSGICECLVGFAALRLHPVVLPAAIFVYGGTAISAILSLKLLPAWIEAYTHARRAYQAVPVRPGEVELMQALLPAFVLLPAVLLVWAVFVFLRSRRGTAAA